MSGNRGIERASTAPRRYGAGAVCSRRRLEDIRAARQAMGPLLIAAVVMTAVACGDPGYDVTVSVVDDAGNPVPDVEVEMDCPPAGLMKFKDHMTFGRTDKAGSVHQHHIGEVHLECWIHAPKQKSDRVDVAACCKKEHPYLKICSRLSTTLHIPSTHGGE